MVQRQFEGAQRNHDMIKVLREQARRDHGKNTATPEGGKVSQAVAGRSWQRQGPSRSVAASLCGGLATAREEVHGS
jgi:hypothetical protein